MILALWAVPRSTSTAFEWMMRQRGGLFDCWHEPFGEAWYQGEDPLKWPRAGARSQCANTGSQLRHSVWAASLQDAMREKASVFSSRIFPHYIETHVGCKEFLGHFTHSFLIRDPAKVMTSMYKHWPDFVLKETGFIEQRALFERIADKTGTAPPVIDSDDLLEDPHRIVELYCNAVGIPHLPEALSWQPGARDEVSWWDGGSFHDNLRNSDGLKPQKRKYIDISDAPDRVKEIHDICRPHYERLYEHRLVVG